MSWQGKAPRISAKPDAVMIGFEQLDGPADLETRT